MPVIDMTCAVAKIKCRAQCVVEEVNLWGCRAMIPILRKGISGGYIDGAVSANQGV